MKFFQNTFGTILAIIFDTLFVKELAYCERQLRLVLAVWRHGDRQLNFLISYPILKKNYTEHQVKSLIQMMFMVRFV